MNEKITPVGAFVTEDGSAYCADVTWCLEKAFRKREGLIPYADIVQPYDLQTAIMDGNLRFYKKIFK